MADACSEKSISDVLGEYRTTFYSDEDHTPEPNTILQTMIDLMTRVDIRLSAIEKNTSTLDQVNQKLDTLTARVETAENTVTNVQKRMKELESDMEGHGNLFDGVWEEAHNAYRGVLDLRQEIRKAGQSDRHMKDEIAELRRMCTELQTKQLDARCRSMKYNLLFHGIAEANEGVVEDSEAVLTDFIKTNLSIEEEFEMANVHRIGKRDDPHRKPGRPRPIIGKFLHYKDLTNVKRSAKLLKGTNYGISEQYPPEIEEVRRKLFAIAKAERAEGRKAYVVKDKLYVDKELIDPDKYVFKPRPEVRTPVGPRPPPRNKRPRVGSTPDRA